MVIQTGIVKGHELATNKDNLRLVIMLQVQITDPDDIQRVQYMSHVGQDEIPPLDSVVTIININSSFKIAVASDDLIESTMLTGEKKIYSTAIESDVLVIKSFINLLKTGILELNGNTDFAVRYTALETAITDLNTKYDAHIHPDPVSGNSGPPTVALGLDISAAKVEEVKII